MNLLDKFDAVEVKADRRISETDKAYCEAQHAAYAIAGQALTAIADHIAEAFEEQKKILLPITTGDYYPYESYFNTDHLPEDRIREDAIERHAKFIRRLVSHFTSRYNVSLDADQIVTHLIPDAPERPYHYGYGAPDSIKEQYLKDWKKIRRSAGGL